MNNIFSLTAEEILAIPLTDPERIFTGDEVTAKEEYRRLALQWHPDHNHGIRASEVFTYVTQLYKTAEDKLLRGIWSKPFQLSLKDVEGVLHTYHFKKKHLIELGEMYIMDHEVVFVIHADYKDLYNNAGFTISHFKYSSDKMQEEFSQYLPHLSESYTTVDDLIMVVRKPADLILLQDVSDFYKGKLSPRHVAWIMSSLYNLACYFEWAGLTHNALSLDTYFISPSHHSGSLLGGWWYAAAQGQKLKAVPHKLLNCIPDLILKTKLADIRLDLELIRAVGRELLCGSRDKIHLLKDCGAPQSLIDWCCFASARTAMEDYKAWYKIVPTFWGKRQFTELPITPMDVYPGSP